MGDTVIGSKQLVIDGQVRSVPLVDASRERHVDWKREVDAGNLKQVRTLPTLPVNPSGPNGVHHVQGEVVTREESLQRNRPEWVMNEIAEQAKAEGRGRFPDGYDKRTNTYTSPTARVGLGAPEGGWPRLKRDTCIVKGCVRSAVDGEVFCDRCKRAPNYAN